MVIKFICEYDGKGFNGFQRQKELRTVQSVLETAISKYIGVNINIVASGRTDTGVHASNQVCSFSIGRDLAGKFAATKLLHKAETAINHFLPADVAIRNLEIAPDDFHARYSAKSKTYIYKCYVSTSRRPLFDDTHLQLYTKPNVALMQEASRVLIGTHDFKSFSSVQTDKTNFVRTIHDLMVIESGEEVLFIIKGNGFLRNMVRIIVGTLLEIESVEQMQKILAGKNRKLAGKTAVAKGLILHHVEY